MARDCPVSFRERRDRLNGRVRLLLGSSIIERKLILIATYCYGIGENVWAILISRRIDSVAMQPSCRMSRRICTELNKEMKWQAWMRSRCIVACTHCWKTCWRERETIFNQFALDISVMPLCTTVAAKKALASNRFYLSPQVQLHLTLRVFSCSLDSVQCTCRCPHLDKWRPWVHIDHSSLANMFRRRVPSISMSPDRNVTNIPMNL